MRKVLLADLGEFVREILESLDFAKGTSRAALIMLCGDLGAGKTTFVQALAKELGVTKTVQSPTYVLMKKYQTTNSKFKTLVHIDLYRLEKPEELAVLQLENYLSDPYALVCIEWPERAGNLLPNPALTIKFSSDLLAGKAGAAGEGERYIEVI